MDNIVIFGGTTEGRKLSEVLAAAGIFHILCVATEYGEIVLKKQPFVKICKGRMTQEEMRECLERERAAAVVDATHPYAEEVTENIRRAAAETKVLYLRLKRERAAAGDCEREVLFESHEACAEALGNIKGNILLTTGSKELSVYSRVEDIRKRLYVRVLPGVESLSACMEQGICGKQILALQGPFSTELNEAIIRQYDIACIVTKNSGKTGGYPEKQEAAKRQQIPLFVIGKKEKEEAGLSFFQVCTKLGQICGRNICAKPVFCISLAGIGMGGDGNLTKETELAIREADILLGAERLTAPFTPAAEKKPFYKKEQILSYLEELLKKEWVREKGVKKEPVKVMVLFSGDSGFYSGCQTLYRALQEADKQGKITAQIRIFPGISSVAYLAACIGESYEDAEIISIHGRSCDGLLAKIRENAKTFLLTSGCEDIRALGKLLTEHGPDCSVVTGRNMSYPEMELCTRTPQECMEAEGEGLYTCFIRNNSPVLKTLTPGIRDEAFLRGKVPMTKEEVREVSICKLRLHKEAVVYDIGSGIGSVAVDIAGISEEISVFAIEKKEEALSLIEKNKVQFGCSNLCVVEGEAPEVFEDIFLKTKRRPTHAFIGGSGGRLREIITVLLKKNKKIRIVVNAVSLETICELREVAQQFQIRNMDMVQLQVSRTREAGKYHLMQAQNPVWICAFDGKQSD